MRGDFRDSFETAFYAPENHHWQSERGRWLWIELQVLMDRIAGPLYSVAERGGCKYVYSREDVAVADPGGLGMLLQSWHTDLVAEIEAFRPALASEETDQRSARIFAEQIWMVTQAGLEIERLRWNAEHKKLN